jgi:hypothetical protein
MESSSSRASSGVSTDFFPFLMSYFGPPTAEADSLTERLRRHRVEHHPERRQMLFDREFFST